MKQDRPKIELRRIASAFALLIGVGASVVLVALALPSLLAARPEPSPLALVSPTPAASPTLTPGPSLAARPTATPTATPPSAAAPTRVVITSMHIDLPVVMPKADETYPWCDVAEYLPYYSVPGMPGITYLYAHAQKGMFLPLLDASLVDDGGSMLDRIVLVYTDDDQVRTYKIANIHRHTTDFAVADAIVGDAVILQTSETGYHTGGKLTVVARPTGSVETISTKEAHPQATPRVCGS